MLKILILSLSDWLILFLSFRLYRTFWMLLFDVVMYSNFKSCCLRWGCYKKK